MIRDDFPSSKKCMSWELLKTRKVKETTFTLITPSAHSPNWKWIWKIPTIPRISCFLWLACLEKLPTLTLLTTRKIISDDSCPLCMSATESLLHSLRDCLVVIPIWLACMPNPNPQFLATYLVLTWVREWSSSFLPCSFNSQILWKDMC